MINATITTRLKIERERKNMTQVELADRAGLTQPLVSMIERGKVLAPAFHTLKAIADGLEYRHNPYTLISPVREAAE